jgi:hypothetical protein
MPGAGLDPGHLAERIALAFRRTYMPSPTWVALIRSWKPTHHRRSERVMLRLQIELDLRQSRENVPACVHLMQQRQRLLWRFSAVIVSLT